MLTSEQVRSTSDEDPRPPGHLRILFTITAYPPSIGGAQLHTHQVAKKLGSSNQVQVICQWTGNKTRWLLDSTLLAPWGGQSSYKLENVPVAVLRFSALERALMVPQVLTYYFAQPHAIARIAALLEPKIYEYGKEADLIHNARIGREPLSYASLSLARKLSIPFVFVPYHHPRWVGGRYKAYLKLYAEADALIAMTNVEKETLIQLGAREDRVFVTGMGPILAEEANCNRARAKFQLGDHPFVLFLGQKFAYKGIQALVEASETVWKKHPEVQFLFVGPRTRFSQRLFKKHTDRRIIEVGPVNVQDKTDLLAASELLCVPSSQESFGGVLTEAWTMNKPVIGCGIPATSEVVSEGQDGFLVQQNAAEVAERILFLLNNPSVAQKMGAAGNLKVSARYNWTVLAELTAKAHSAALA